jgi:DNA-binding CsgD family transcriptional regulator
LTPTIVSDLLGRRRHHDPLGELSGREREVLSLVAEGLSNKAIASTLFVTEATVEAQVTQLFEKLGQQLLHFPVGQPEPQVPPYRQHDHLRREPNPANTERAGTWRLGRSDQLHAAGSCRSATSSVNATDP